MRDAERKRRAQSQHAARFAASLSGNAFGVRDLVEYLAGLLHERLTG